MKQKNRLSFKNQAGISHIIIPLGIVVVLVVAFIGYRVMYMSHAYSTPGPIVGVASKCLDNSNNRLALSNPITLQTCNGSAEQKWSVNSSGTITNQGWCLAVKAAGTTPETAVQLYSCNGATAQVWTPQSSGAIKNPHSGLCLDDKAAKTADGNPIQIYTCNGTAAQVWKITTGPVGTNPTPPSPPPSGDCTVSANLVNSCRPWLGAWAANYPQTDTGVRNQFLYHEKRVGRQIDIFKDYRNGGGGLSDDDKTLIARANTYALITWRPSTTTFAAADGGNASVNAAIDTMADSIKSVAPHRLFLSIWHEPENDVSSDPNCPNTKFVGKAGTPAEYVQMWQNVRKRFDAKGVNNVVWTENYMGFSNWQCVSPHLYAGNNLVDWIMFDPYVGGDKGTFNEAVASFYNFMTANSDSTHNYTSKTWGLSEVSSHEDSQATAWKFWEDAKTALDNNTFPRLKAYVVFDSGNGKPDNRVGYHCLAWTTTASGDNCTNTVQDSTKQAKYNAFANDSHFK